MYIVATEGKRRGYLKINEVEACVGITRKNIRFYESEGLLSPRRNRDNGYRDYGKAEIEILKQIKLLRKLGFPLEEIRKMQKGELTVSDGMDRHRVLLERQSKNITQSISLCDRFALSATRLEELDTTSVLEEMESLENKGATFQNKYEKDRKINRISAVIITVFIVLIMAIGNTFAVWEMMSYSEISVIAIIIIVASSTLVILSLLFVLFSRLREISDGEIEKAKRY